MEVFREVRGGVAPPAFAGQLGLAYITSLMTPAPGYAVAVPKPGGGYARHNCFIGDGSAQGALEAATKWRDEKHLALHGLSVPVRAFHKKQANSTSGIIGVRQKTKVVKKKLASGETRLYEVPVVIAQVWLEPGLDRRRPHKSQSKVFSVKKHGLEVALELATQWRLEQCARLAQTPPRAERIDP